MIKQNQQFVEANEDAEISGDGQVVPKKPANFTVPGTVRDASIGGLAIEGEAKKTKEKLSKEPKVSIYIPLDPGEGPGAYRSVTINGYRFEIKKNVMVEVPRSVAALIMHAYNIEGQLGQNHPLNLNNQGKDVHNALGVA